MTRTFSKIYGLAALRLGWMYGPAHVVDALNRIRGPFNVNAPAIAAGIAAIEDTAHVGDVARSTTTNWLAWLTEEIGKLGLKVTPSVGQFHPDPLSRDQGPHRGGRRRVPHQARADPAPGRRLQAAERAAHDGRHRGGQPAGGRGARGVHGEAGVTDDTPIYQPPRADRRRPDRRLDRARGARAGRGALDRRHRALAADAQARRRARHRRSGGRDQRRRGRRAPTSSSSAFRSARAARCAKEIGPHLMKPGAIVSDVGSVKGAVVRDMAPAPAAQACISFRRIRSPAPRIPGRTPALPSCSSTAGAS